MCPRQALVIHRVRATFAPRPRLRPAPGAHTSYARADGVRRWSRHSRASFAASGVRGGLSRQRMSPWNVAGRSLFRRCPVSTNRAGRRAADVGCGRARREPDWERLANQMTNSAAGGLRQLARLRTEIGSQRVRLTNNLTIEPSTLPGGCAGTRRVPTCGGGAATGAAASALSC
jgi:hypothetical protein